MANTKAPQASDSVDFELLSAQIAELAQGEQHWLPILANAAALLGEALPHINWAGFYVQASLLAKSFADHELILGPFWGKVACTRIPYGQGVCGTAAAQDEVLVVNNVHEFAGHIACDAASNSEIVIPIRVCGRVVGVLDIDSPLFGRFTQTDKSGLCLVTRGLERYLEPLYIALYCESTPA